MATYDNAPKVVRDLAVSILNQYPSYVPLVAAEVKLDILFAYGRWPKKGGFIPAMKDRGHRILAKTRIVSLKDRAKDIGDAEIILDADWWKDATEPQRAAVLDHELFHLEPVKDKHGRLKRDDLNRPRLRIRAHDVEVGWFNTIASRHADSQERLQATYLMDNVGQYYWPQFSAQEPEAPRKPSVREPVVMTAGLLNSATITK